MDVKRTIEIYVKYKDEVTEEQVDEDLWHAFTEGLQNHSCCIDYNMKFIPNETNISYAIGD